VQLGAYTFETYKSKKKGDAKKPRLKSAVILSPFARQTTATKAVERAATVTAAVNTARDWVNMPPGDFRPADFAEAITAHAGTDVKVSVWDEKRLARERCGGILGVGRGSDSPPRLATLTYAPANAVTHLALVGKGITFDSGGLSIKPGASMQTMKLDMAGAAAIVAATDAGSGIDPRSIRAQVDGKNATTKLSGTRLSVSTAGLAAGSHALVVTASDYQESKNMEDVPRILPNTRTLRTTFVVR